MTACRAKACQSKNAACFKRRLEHFNRSAAIAVHFRIVEDQARSHTALAFIAELAANQELIDLVGATDFASFVYDANEAVAFAICASQAV